jgi:hypothetical protein
MDSEITVPIFESLQIACLALGAVVFVDLFHVKSRSSIQDADERFRWPLVLRSRPPSAQVPEATSAAYERTRQSVSDRFAAQGQDR